MGNDPYFAKNYWDNIQTRRDLGNQSRADAIRYYGRGVIQLTGRRNYQRCGADIGVDLLSHPEKVLDPEISAKAFAWFWALNHLAEVAALAGDKAPKTAGRTNVWTQIRRVVNGPKMNGFASYYQAIELFGAA